MILISFIFILLSQSTVEVKASSIDCSLKEIPCERFDYSSASAFESSFREYGHTWGWPERLVNIDFSDVSLSCSDIDTTKSISILKKSPSDLWIVGNCLLLQNVERGVIFELEQMVISQFINFNRK